MKQSITMSRPFLNGRLDAYGNKPTISNVVVLSAPAAGSRRAKPLSLAIINGTGYAISRQEMRHEQCTESGMEGFAPNKTPWTTFYATGTAYPLGKYYDPLEFDTTVETVARNKALADARGRTVNLANALGEYRKTAKLFPELAEKVYRLTMAAKHRDPRILLYGYWYHQYSRYGGLRPDIAKRTLDNLAREWLRYIYGVKPLMDVMNDSIIALKNRKDPKVPPMRVVARNMARANSQINASDAWGRPCTVVRISQKSVKVLADIDFRNEILNSSLGSYGFTNPLGVAWELLPFSFVIDWWVNVGEFIESLDNCLYFSGTSWSQVVTRYKQTSLVSVRGGSGSGVFESYSRSQPQQLGTIATPRLKLSPSALHVANGVALLRTLSSGRFR